MRALLIVACLCAVILCALSFLRRSYIATYAGAGSIPLDWAGEGAICPDCGELLKATDYRRYSYRCPSCNQRFRVLRDSEGAVVIDRL
jgi:hypothetical protein